MIIGEVGGSGCCDMNKTVAMASAAHRGRFGGLRRKVYRNRLLKPQAGSERSELR
jgi:hypothetical protein